MGKSYHHQTKFQKAARIAVLITCTTKIEEHCEVRDSSYESITPLAIISHHFNAVPSF